MQVRIRRAGDGDREAFWKATMDTAWSDIPDDERAKLDRKEFEEYFRRVASPYLEEYNNHLFIAEDERGNFLGHTLLGRTIPFYSSRPYGFVYDIYVAAGARRQGVGMKLLEFAFKWFKEQGLDKVKLEAAHVNTTARSLYEKMGFVPERLVMGKVLQ